MFAKLFSSITESSLWSEPKEVRLLFVTMLAKADQTGFVEASIPGLARVANLTVEETESGLECLQSPDTYSKNPDHEGRRILSVPGGFMLLNYEDYRSRRSTEERREYMREYMQEYRKQSVNSRKQTKTKVKLSKPPLAQAEAEAEAEAVASPVSVSKRFAKPNISQLDSYAIELAHPEFDSEAFVDYYDSVGWTVGKNKPMKDWKAAVRTWIKRNKPKPKESRFIQDREERERYFLEHMHDK